MVMDSGRWQTPSAQGPVRARLRLPGSKSITNRALVLAALSDSPSVIRGPLKARDTTLAIAALRALGCAIDNHPAIDNQQAIDDHGDYLAITPGQPSAGGVSVDVGNAGTVLRFLPAVAALTAATVSFDGDPRARERPVGALLAAPRFDEGVQVRHEGPPVPSVPHLEMTARMLRQAGAQVEVGYAASAQAPHPRATDVPGPAEPRPSLWRVRPGPLNLGDFRVEPDLSNAGPFLAAALVTGGSVTIADWPGSSASGARPHVGPSVPFEDGTPCSLQAADAIIEVFTRMGASCSLGPDGLTISGTGIIHGIQADLRDIPELCLPLTSVAALASGPSEFTGVGHTRAQETDRLAAIAKEINALGGDITESPDGLRVRPRPLHATAGHGWDSYDDHRMVMAAAVLGLATPGIEVLNVATVGKTFPSFTALWAELLGHPSPEPAS